MKAIFISAFQAFYDEIIAVFDKLEVRGFTYWSETQGRGSHSGEPHYGTHAWPSLNCSFLAFVEEQKVDNLLDALKALDETAEQQGLRAFVMPCEKMI
jgi:nitrogen regulatory protein PII